MCIRDSWVELADFENIIAFVTYADTEHDVDALVDALLQVCLLYTSDAADDLLCVDLGGRRIITKKKKTLSGSNGRTENADRS